MQDASIWSGLGNAPIFESGTFFNPGSIHDVQIGRCLLKQSRESGLGFIVETDILTSQATGEIDDKTRLPFIPLPAGMAGTWWQGMTDKAVALPAIKQFVHAVLSLGPSDPRRQMLEQMVPGSDRWRCNRTGRPMPLIESLMLWAQGEANVLQGIFLHLETKYHRTQKGRDFTIHTWTPIDYAARGMSPPDVDGILRNAWNEPPIQIDQGNQWNQPPQGPPQGYNPPQGHGQGYGGPSNTGYSNQGPPQGQFGTPPQGQWNQPSQGQFGTPPGGFNQYQGQPPPGYGQPQGPPQATPPAGGWSPVHPSGNHGPPQGPPQGQFGPPPGNQPWNRNGR
jgi:hypothetical protein